MCHDSLAHSHIAAMVKGTIGATDERTGADEGAASRVLGWGLGQWGEHEMKCVL